MLLRILENMVASMLSENRKSLETISFKTFSGADNQIRTGDLMLTKHVLYQLSYISIERCFSLNASYYSRNRTVCQGVLQTFFRIFRLFSVHFRYPLILAEESGLSHAKLRQVEWENGCVIRMITDVFAESSGNRQKLLKSVKKQQSGIIASHAVNNTFASKPL